MQSLLLDTPAPETPGRDEAPAAAQQEPAARDRVDEPEGPTATQAGEQTPATQAPAAEAPAAATPLIVEDSGEQPLEPGQARRAEFLTQLQTAVVNTAEEELVGTGWSAANCPWIDQWFAYYATRSAAQIERAIHRYAPEAFGATTSAAYVDAVVARVRRGVVTWVATGQVTEVPGGVTLGFPFPGLGTGPAAGPLTPGRVLFQARGGGARKAPRASEVQAQLGAGRGLESGTRSRMESVFGSSLSGVRVHTDPAAGTLADGLNARAFAVGQHIAFSPGEYRPGTPIGDALIAHEVAHVLQQPQGSGLGAAPATQQGDDSAFEHDADRSAAVVTASLWTGLGRSLARGAQGAGAKLRSGLRLSRCDKSAEPQKTLNLNISKLEGSSRAIAVADGSTILEAAAGIKVTTGNTETLDKPKSEALIGADLILDEYKSAGNPTAEETALTAVNRTPSRITGYWVKSLSDRHTGESFWPADFPATPASIVLGNEEPWVNGKLLAHELGHVLLDNGAHSGDNTNVMSYSNDGVSLTPDERKKARSSPFVS